MEPRESRILSSKRFWVNLFPVSSSVSRFVDEFRLFQLERNLRLEKLSGRPKSFKRGLAGRLPSSFPAQAHTFSMTLNPTPAVFKSSFLFCFWFCYFTLWKTTYSKRKALLEAQASAGGPWSGGCVSIFARRCGCWEVLLGFPSRSWGAGGELGFRFRRASDFRLRTSPPSKVEESSAPLPLHPTTLEQKGILEGGEPFQ